MAALRDRWIECVHRAATGSKRMRNIFTPIGAAVFAVFVGAFIFAALKTDQLFGLPVLLSSPLRIALAIPVMVSSAFLTGWSVLYFLKSRGTPVPFNPPPVLVISGPYALVRNPMLSGVFGLLFGLGLLLGSVALTCIYTPLFILFNAWELKAIEEPELERRLGSAYIEYKRRTPMFFPRLKTRRTS